MVRLGLALTVIAILGMLSNLIIRVIISNYGSISQVGVFEAGVVIEKGIVTENVEVFLQLFENFYFESYSRNGNDRQLWPSNQNCV